MDKLGVAYPQKVRYYLGTTPKPDQYGWAWLNTYTTETVFRLALIRVGPYSARIGGCCRKAQPSARGTF